MSAERTGREHGDADISKNFINECLRYKNHNNSYLCSAIIPDINMPTMYPNKGRHGQIKPANLQKNRVYSDS